MPDRAQATGFLEHWAKLTGTVALVAIFKEKEERRPLQFHSYQPGGEEAVWSWATEWNAKGHGIYYHVGRTRPGFIGKATKKDIEAVVALHADLDPRVGEPLAEERARIGELLTSPPAGIPPPAVVVDSGRGMQGVAWFP